MAEIVASAQVNESSPNVIHNRSRFNLSHKNFDTHRFGYYAPHFVIDGIPGDKLRIRSNNELRSYTLKAPLMQNVIRHLDYVKVDLPAILPMNFEKVYQNPTIGDDVLVDVNCVVDDFVYKVTDLFAVVYNYYKSYFVSGISDSNLTNLFHLFVFGELFFSKGSLLASLHCDLSQCLTIARYGTTIVSYDALFDAVVSHVAGVNLSAPGSSFNVSIDGNSYTVVMNESDVHNDSTITYRHFLEEIRSTSDWFFNTGDSIGTNLFPSGFGLDTAVVSGSLSTVKIPINFSRVFAYQLACAEFFTNDSVDYIYSAELFRQYIGSLISSCVSIQSFTYNGVSYQYDYLSGKYLSMMLSFLGNNFSNIPVHQYFLSLFSYNRSLRYKDYFVGARTRPLAVGDVNVSVSSNQFSVVDVSRKVQIQRFLNAVNHTGRRLSNYIKTMFGEDISQDRHVPHFIMNLTENIFSSEVENTGVAQQTESQSITANFRSNSGNYEVEVGVDVPCVIIGVTSYDIERSYLNNIDRHYFIRDRYDMFLPQMQFVGDQPIYKHELYAGDPSAFGSAFAYQFRNMEDKIVPSRSHGAFAEGSLPGFNFAFFGRRYRTSPISPDFIRSLACELDNLYLSLTGYSLATYFHFIVNTENVVDASREMIANPEILG